MALVLAHVLAVVSALLGALFVLGVLDPRRLVAVARSLLGGTGAAGAVAVRLLLAALLWFSAPVSLNPGAFRVLASVMLVAAVAALVLGTDRLARLVDRMADLAAGLRAASDCSRVGALRVHAMVDIAGHRRILSGQPPAVSPLPRCASHPEASRPW